MIEFTKRNVTYWDSVFLFFNNSLIREINILIFECSEWDFVQQIVNTIELRMSFRCWLDHSPWLTFCVCINQHVIFCSRISIPFVEWVNIGLRKLPSLVRCVESGSKTIHLLVWVDREPIFDQDNTRSLEKALEDGDRSKKLLVLHFSTEAHHLFNTCSVVPAPIKQYHFSSWRQVIHISLKVPLRLLIISRGG